MRNPGKQFRDLLRTEPYLFTGGVYSPLDAQIAEKVGMKGAGGERETSRLRDERINNPGMTVSLVDCRISRQEIVIPFAVDVPEKNAFTPGEHDRKGVVVMCPVFRLQVQVMQAFLG